MEGMTCAGDLVWRSTMATRGDAVVHLDSMLAGAWKELLTRSASVVVLFAQGDFQPDATPRRRARRSAKGPEEKGSNAEYRGFQVRVESLRSAFRVRISSSNFR